MRRVLYSTAALVSLACVSAAMPLQAHAQTQVQATASDDTPRIDEVIFKGADHISASVLGDSIVTQPTKCRGLLLKPLCAISKSSYFVDKHNLDPAEIPRDELRIRVIYFRAGYRHATVSTEITPVEEGKVNVTFNIVEGPPTTIVQRTMSQADTVLTSRQLRQALMPDSGDLLNLAKIDSAKIRLRGKLWDLGYADATVEDSVHIDASQHTAVLDVFIDPVHHTTIDTILIHGNEQVSNNTIRRLLGLHEGDLYRRSDMTAAQRRVYETEIFRQTLVQVPVVPDSAKTIEITVREAPFTALRAGVGFNTTEFGQTELRLTRYNWFGGARRLDVRGAVGNLLAHQFHDRSIFGTTPAGADGTVDDRFLSPTWELGATLNEPFVLDARATLSFGVSTHRRSIPGIVIDRGYSANSSLTWRFDNRVTGSLIYQFEQARVEAGDLYFCVNFGVCGLNTISALRSSQKLSPLMLRGLAENADDPLAPTRGYTAMVEIEHASALTASDFRYNRISADVARYFPRGRSVFAVHARAGWVRPSESTGSAVGVDVADNSILHPRKRFYAGGARSVRGYGENQLGPRVLTIDPLKLLDPSDEAATPCTLESIADGSCDPNVAQSKDFIPRPLGGNTLLEASVEYRFPLTESLRGAVFVDAGSVRGERLNLPPGNRTAVTPGFGIRYSSPIGPVRLDLGIRPGLAEELPVVTQVPDTVNGFHIVQLETPMKYNPVQGSGGFLRSITSRLQLHLAIGEAW
jgi:outer membrane protein assembly complex protein YaeT